MEVIGIIAEYNPFHNGHLYHIHKVKEMYPESLIVLIINGYFSQRGEMSILTKEEKILIALQNKIDLVIELPYVFGSQAADIFAYNSIKLLNEFKITKIVFGSESNDIERLKKMALEQANNDFDYKVRTHLKEGINYPTALAKSMSESLNQPNDLLGISYLKAILKINAQITPVTIKRTNNYHDMTAQEKIISASNIRHKLQSNLAVDDYVPYEAKILHLVNESKYFELLKYKLLSEHDLSKYLTVDEGIENLLTKVIQNCYSLEELVKALKTKRYTYNKIKRMLTHIIVGLKKGNYELDYIKILGFNHRGQNYLKEIKKSFTLPLYSNKINSLLKDYELKTSLIYDLINNTSTWTFEKKNQPIKVKD